MPLFSVGHFHGRPSFSVGLPIYILISLRVDRVFLLHAAVVHQLIRLGYISLFTTPMGVDHR